MSHRRDQPTDHRRSARATAVVVVALLALIGAAGCSSSAPLPDPSTPPTLSAPTAPPTAPPTAGSTMTPAPSAASTPAPEQAEPSDTGSREYARGTATRISEGYSYTVVAGDTMSGIGERFRVCVRDIARANGFDLDIVVGQVLTIKRSTRLALDSGACKESTV